MLQHNSLVFVMLKHNLRVVKRLFTGRALQCSDKPEG